MSRLDPIKEAAAAKGLIESLRAESGTDDELLLDMVEGETSLFEAIDALLLRMVESKGLAEGVSAAIQEMEARKRRFEARYASDKTIIEQALMIAEIEAKVERPLATLTLARRAPKVEIQTEADIPAEFWKTGDPTLDKKALLAALKDGTPVPGACLSNAAPSLTARFA